MQYQKLRKDHPYIILSIHRRKQLNLGLLICKSLEYHITTAKQIDFPSTITTMCARAGVNIAQEIGIFLKPVIPLGARAFNKLALARGEQPILDERPDTFVANNARSGTADTQIDSLIVVQDQGEMKNELLLRILVG